MNGQKVVILAACAGKSSQEAKKAEAHARASRVYAKKAEKDAKDAQILAARLMLFAKNTLLRMFHTNDKDEISLEDLDALIKIANVSDPLVNADMLHSLINFEKTDFENEKAREAICLNENQIIKIENELVNNANNKESCSESEPETVEKPTLADACLLEVTAQNNPESESSNHANNRNSLNFQTINPSSVKRKLKQQKKTRATGAISPLLSKEEITIVKRATSPSTSQHSGLNPHLGTHHKYSVRMKYSTSSLHSTLDDDERMVSSTGLVRSMEIDGKTKTLVIHQDHEKNY